MPTRNCKFILTAGASFAALSIALAVSGPASAGSLPGRGYYVDGHGSISKGNQSLTVKQSSTTGIINWNSFSVGKHDGVTFDNGHGATLNRVTGGNLSSVSGYLHATGSLYLLNSAGVIVSGTGRIITGGNFIASSGSLTNSAFNGDQRRFGNSSAKIINHGSITAGAEAKLVGSSVTNTGTITGAHVNMRATDGAMLAGGTIGATGDAHRAGRILVISYTGATKITGTLSARNCDGSGGSIETSGRRVAIGGRVDAGNGGIWLVDPENLTIDATAANTIDTALDAGTDVELQTTKSSASGPGTESAGRGDIIVASALAWDTSAELTLHAYHSVLVNAPTRIENGGSLSLAASHGNLLFSGGDIHFDTVHSGLIINGNTYVLVSNLQMLAGDISANPSGLFALAKDYDAKSEGSYASSPVSTVFSGTLEGLGNTISHLTLDESASDAQGDLGLFSDISGGTVRDISLTSLSVTARHAAFIGGIAGENDGLIEDVSVSGTMVASGIANSGSAIGLLAGYAGAGKVVASHAEGKITGAVSYAGGLEGSGAAISNSWADVTLDISRGSHGIGSEAVGGLVGVSAGDVSNAYSLGDVTGAGNVGGFVGRQVGGTKIFNSYETGDVSDGGGDTDTVGGFEANGSGEIKNSFSTGNVTVHGMAGESGGFVGDFEDGSVRSSYSTGNLSVGKSDGNFSSVGGFAGYLDEGVKVTVAYETGDVTAKFQSDIGGFVGDLDNRADDPSLIENAYATGAVNAKTDGEDHVGGFAGENESKIEDAYATGRITASGGGEFIKGFVGDNGQMHNGGLEHCYWDVDTTGISGSKNSGKGVTTAQLTGALLPGFKSDVWDLSPDSNGGFPFLIALVPAE